MQFELITFRGNTSWRPNIYTLTNHKIGKAPQFLIAGIFFCSCWRGKRCNEKSCWDLSAHSKIVRTKWDAESYLKWHWGLKREIADHDLLRSSINSAFNLLGLWEHVLYSISDSMERGSERIACLLKNYFSVWKSSKVLSSKHHKLCPCGSGSNLQEHVIKGWEMEQVKGGHKEKSE